MFVVSSLLFGLACTGKGDIVTTPGDTAGAVSDDTGTSSDDTGLPPENTCTEDDLGDLYDRYIEPVVTDAHPSSCNQCHLAGIDLGMYIQDTPCQSMACMEHLGVVDLDAPTESQILDFILQADPDSDLITEDVIQQEYDGFLEWIEWSAECHDEVCGEIEDPCDAGTSDNTLPEDVLTPLGGCDEETLAAYFEEKVWAWHGRCWSCHYAGGTSHESYPDSTPFYVWNDDNADSSRQTMYNLIGIGAIDTADPANSALLTKPLAEGLTVSSTLGSVTGAWHGGGDKFSIGDTDAFTDETFYDFADWILYYTSCLE